jgi:hypothetical protein
MTLSIPSDREARRWVESYCRERPGLSFCSCEVREVKRRERDTWVFLDFLDKRCPELFLIREPGGESPAETIPYFPIRERPDRQIVSYSLGKGLCNLAEVSEFFRGLYSRYCGSYRPGELPQQKADLSKIALWVHDCLTEDFDHQTALNRQNLPEGVCISYDFGMAFSNHYFPPFYTLELGISEESIPENRLFVLDLLARYARWVLVDEEEAVRNLETSYPATCHADRCRYYLRNYKAHFRTRLYFGRFFEKMRNTPFERGKLDELAERAGLDMTGVTEWETLVKEIRSGPRGTLDLRGLDLSDMDLRRSDLRGADLTGASLAGADLEEADLRGAKLSGVDWTDTNLKNVRQADT